jgi:hypothetical protein
MVNITKCSSAIILLLVSFVSQAGLIGRDLDTNTAGFEAYYDDILDITWLADSNYAYTSRYPNSTRWGGMTTVKHSLGLINYQLVDTIIGGYLLLG